MERKIWHERYEKGVPQEINLAEYSSVVDILEQSFEKYPKRPALHCMGKTYNYEEVEILSRRFASYLQNDLNLKKGDRVALMMPNVLQYPIVLFGILRAGLVAVNVNPLYTPRELEHQLNDSGAETIIIFESAASTLEEILAKTPVKNILVTRIGDFLSFPKSLIANAVIKHVKKMIPPYTLPGANALKEKLFGADATKYERPVLTSKDTLFLQYTGGTTGVSKGAELTHGNIVANILQARAWTRNHVIEGKEIIITPLPLYHIFSLTANCLLFTSLGSLNVLITNPRDIAGFIKELKKWKFTAFTGVNTLFNGLLNNSDFAHVDFSSLRLTLGGGMAVQKSVAQKWKEVTGISLIEAYGLTETSPAACINPMDLEDHNGKIGIPISSTEIVIRDDAGKDVAVGEVGELCIKGPQVMKGYWNRPDETQNVFTEDAYLKTGDIAFMDERGFFQIVDRKKDMILVSGFNVFPNEVEEVLSGHPGVLEVAVVGVPDQKSGEAVKAFIVKREEALTDEELRAYCKEHLTSYKVPRHYEFRTDLPKSNVGKILRKELRS